MNVAEVDLLRYPTLVGLLHQENTPPGAGNTLLAWARDSGLSDESLIIDLACSTGYSSRRLAALVGCRGVGVDIDPAAIHAAKQLAGREGLNQRLHYEVADACELPLATEAFSHVVAGCTFAFIQNRTKALAEVDRVLQAGGKLCVANFAYRKPPSVEILDSIEELVGFRPSASWTVDWWNDFFSGAGMRLLASHINPLVPFSDEEVRRTVTTAVYQQKHEFSGAPAEIKQAVYRRLKKIRVAANVQRAYQSLMVQTWSKR